MASGIDSVPRSRNIALRIAAGAVAAALCAAAAWWFWHPRLPQAPAIRLLDQDRRPFALAALRGRPVVIVFGYTHCPDVCPTTLAQLARAVRDPRVPRDVAVAFITVDPARDSPPMLKRYIRLFDPHFLALTGDDRALGEVYAAYHVVRRTVPLSGSPGAYIVDHSTTIYYVDRDGALAGLAAWNDGEAQMVRDLQRLAAVRRRDEGTGGAGPLASLTVSDAGSSRAIRSLRPAGARRSRPD